MYPLLIATALGISVVMSLILIPENPFYFFGPFVGMAVFIPTVMLLWRRTADKVQPFFEKANRLAQAGNVDQALEALESAMAWKKWQLFLGKQIHTQIGILLYGAGREKQAVEHLKQGYPKVSEGHLILATILYRDGKLDEAREALEFGIRFNRKSPILYNLLAWFLNKENKRSEAIEVLSQGLKKMKADVETEENLERLRSDKKMSMKSFGQLWFMLKFETPKGMAAAPQVRKGFRAPPKNKGRARKTKR